MPGRFSTRRAPCSPRQAAPSVAAVGRAAGLARSSVYQYFTSTEDLLRAAELIDSLIVQASRAEGSDATAHAAPGGHGEVVLGRLRRLLGGYVADPRRS